MLNKDIYSTFDVFDITSLKYPHSSVNLVAEACCLILAKKPNFANFRALVSEPDFLDKYISRYDPKNSMSDYVMNELKARVENVDFVPEKITLVNKTAGAICKWVLAVYEVGAINVRL